MLIPVREGGTCKKVALCFSFRGRLVELFILEAAPTRPICFRLSVGFISLLHQPTLQQLGTVPEDAGRCLKPVFLPPSLSPDRHWENPIICSLFLSSMWPDSKSNMVSKLLPAPCPKAQQGSGADRGALRRWLQPHSSELPGPGMKGVHKGNQQAEVCCQRTWSSTARSCLYLPPAASTCRENRSAFQLGNSSLLGESPPPPSLPSN